MGMSEMIIQSPDEVVAFLKAQHNLIEDMFDQVLHASDPEAREKPFVQLRQLLAVHETAEEMVVHPRSAAKSTAWTRSSMLASKSSMTPRSCCRRSRRSISPRKSSSTSSPNCATRC